jgi:hypothetical protein
VLAQSAVLCCLPHLVRSETWPVSLSVDWGRCPSFFHCRVVVSDFLIPNLSAVANVGFGVRNDLVHSCTQVYGCEPRIHDSKQTAFSCSKLWAWATMIELESVTHLRLQFAALHTTLSCVEQASVAGTVRVLRQHQSSKDLYRYYRGTGLDFDGNYD